MIVNPRSVLLLDEPGANLEILCQRQIYRVLAETARENGNQIIAASHSEFILNEAADRNTVGSPHRRDDLAAQLLKSQKETARFFEPLLSGVS